MAQPKTPPAPDRRLRLIGDLHTAEAQRHPARPEDPELSPREIPNPTNTDNMASMDRILENLYLGNLEAALDPALLSQHGITHVLSLTSRNADIQLPPEQFKHCWFHVDDHRSQNLLKFLLDSLSFVEEALLSTFTDPSTATAAAEPPAGPSSAAPPTPLNPNHRVFVHCRAGISRSASVVIAFLMKHGHMPFTDALATVREKRPRVNPNEGFRAQLELLESCNFDLSVLGMDIAEMDVWNPYDGEEGWWKQDREREREQYRMMKKRKLEDKAKKDRGTGGGMASIGFSEPQQKIFKNAIKELERRGSIKPVSTSTEEATGG